MFSRLKQSKILRTTLSIIILIITLAVFVYYASVHPDKIIQPLLGLGIGVIVFVVIGYFGITYTNSAILQKSLQILHTPYGHVESFLLTAYSSIVNFFGPLQSGPGFRAVYLKQKLGVKLRDFTLTLIVYYLFFAFINAAVIGMFIMMQKDIVFGLLAATGGMFVIGGSVLFLRKKFSGNRLQKLGSLLASKHAAIIFFFTFLQCSIMAAIYFAELIAVNGAVTIQQALVYTAVANLTLFVSLTPGAIGIRESFLLFSQQLHGIDQQTVIAASVIDRAIYFIVLGLLFLLSLSMHAKKRLALRKSA